MKVGIIGLPNVGKSTLFNAITNMNVLEANYPFATIQPNVGVASVDDERLHFLAKLFQSQKVVKTQIQFIDIAGLVKNASKGEGLGNKFLGNIRDVDAICHVVKCFENPNIMHVNEKVNPTEESDIIETELILSDLEQIEKRLAKLNKQKKSLKEQEFLEESELLNKIKISLENNTISSINLNSHESKIIKNFNLLSLKPMIYICNFQEKDLLNLKDNLFFQQMKLYSESQNRKIIPVCILLEKEISILSEEEQQNFLKIYNLKQNALQEIIQSSYNLLGLQTFFTAGKTETKAWSFLKNMTAPECGRIIHSDFERGFIKVEVCNYEDLFQFQSVAKAKENGKIRLEGKNYLVQDGDIIIFHFNVTK